MTYLDFDDVKGPGRKNRVDPLKIRTLSTVRLQACIR